MAHLSSQQNLMQRPTSHARNFRRAAPPKTILDNSFSGMPGASRSAGHAPLGTRCHAVDGIWAQHSKFNFSRGEFRKTSSRSAVPSAPLVASPKHLEFSIGDCGDQRTAICCRSSCEWLLHVYFIFGLSMVPIVVKETAVTMALTFEKNTPSKINWPNTATKFARRGTQRSLLLSNWSSWHRAASATQWTEFESNDQSSTSPGESSARLPASLRPHRHLWWPRQSTWSSQ